MGRKAVDKEQKRTKRRQQYQRYIADHTRAKAKQQRDRIRQQNRRHQSPEFAVHDPLTQQTNSTQTFESVDRVTHHDGTDTISDQNIVTEHDLPDLNETRYETPPSLDSDLDSDVNEVKADNKHTLIYLE